MSVKAALDANGHEVPDPNPLALPSGFQVPETLQAQIQRLVRNQLSQDAANAGFETWAESNDFEVDDDFDPSTPYEEFFDPVLQKSVTPDEFVKNADRYRDEVLVRTQNYYRIIEQEEALLGRQKPAPDPEPPKTGETGQRPVAKPLEEPS